MNNSAGRPDKVCLSFERHFFRMATTYLTSRYQVFHGCVLGEFSKYKFNLELSLLGMNDAYFEMGLICENERDRLVRENKATRGSENAQLSPETGEQAISGARQIRFSDRIKEILNQNQERAKSVSRDGKS